MAEWLYEAGIGEERAILVEGGAILAARVCWGERLRAGLVAEAKLTSKPAGARRGLARLEDGDEVLVDALPATTNEGDAIRVRIVRPALAEHGRTKRPLARHEPTAPPRPAPSLLDQLRAGSAPVREVRVAGPEFAAHGWDELVEQALSGEIAFAGGSLTVSPTPAMTLIDVDGSLSGPRLALAAVPAIAQALGRLDIGGSVGIDFPTLAGKRDRQAVDRALGEALAGSPGRWQGERTAMNGFGLVQLVSRLERPSLVARYARRGAAAARILLRGAERVAAPGALELVAHPTIRGAIRPEWEAELARRTGRQIRWREDPQLVFAGGFAQAVPA
ncbi:MAG: ribonuclease E/G [Novosphingobium sp.]|nr:ribonuclease E/G [Novosphingobium sp.]